QTSPCSPGATSRVGSDRSRKEMMVPGTGRPIEPGLFNPSNGLDVTTGDVSDSPYPSTSLQPVTASNRSLTSTGKAAPPERQYFSEEKSRFLNFGWFIKALKRVGTPGITVGLVAAISWIASSSTKRGIMMSSAALAIPKFKTTVSAKTWKKGRIAS